MKTLRAVRMILWLALVFGLGGCVSGVRDVHPPVWVRGVDVGPYVYQSRTPTPAEHVRACTALRDFVAMVVASDRASYHELAAEIGALSLPVQNSGTERALVRLETLVFSWAFRINDPHEVLAVEQCR